MPKDSRSKRKGGYVTCGVCTKKCAGYVLYLSEGDTLELETLWAWWHLDYSGNQCEGANQPFPVVKD